MEKREQIIRLWFEQATVSGGKSCVVLRRNVLILEGGTDGRDTICTGDR